VIRTVPIADLQRTLDHMELTVEFATAVSPHCQSVNLFPGFSALVAFTCRECGEAVSLSG